MNQSANRDYSELRVISVLFSISIGPVDIGNSSADNCEPPEILDW